MVVEVNLCLAGLVVAWDQTLLIHATGLAG